MGFMVNMVGVACLLVIVVVCLPPYLTFNGIDPRDTGEGIDLVNVHNVHANWAVAEHVDAPLTSMQALLHTPFSRRALDCVGLPFLVGDEHPKHIRGLRSTQVGVKAGQV